MRLTDVSVLSEGGHLSHWQGNTGTTLLWFRFRGCLTFISSETLRFTGINPCLMEFPSSRDLVLFCLHDSKSKTSCRRSRNKADVWLAERNRKSGRFRHHLTLTLGFPICLPATTWLPNLDFQTPRPSCGSSFSPLSVRRRLTTQGTHWLWSWSPSFPWWASAPVSAGTHGGGTGSCEAHSPGCVPVARCCHPTLY